MDREKFRESFGGHPYSVHPSGPSERDERIHHLARNLVVMQIAGGQQGIVQLVGIARIGALFIANALDGGLIENARSSGVDRLGTTFFQGSIVEEGEGLGVDDVERERRGLDGVARE